MVFGMGRDVVELMVSWWQYEVSNNKQIIISTCSSIIFRYEKYGLRDSSNDCAYCILKFDSEFYVYRITNSSTAYLIKIKILKWYIKFWRVFLLVLCICLYRFASRTQKRDKRRKKCWKRARRTGEK